MINKDKTEYSIHTINICHSRATMLPATDIVIAYIHKLGSQDKMGNRLTVGDSMGDSTIQDINIDSNDEDDDASNANYFAESDVTEVSLQDTIVVNEIKADEDNNIMTNLEQNNY